MAVAKRVRLFKLATEINIGKDTIVAFLQSKGYDIENKPTANLDEEMVNLVHDKFKRELRAAEVQREKIEKHKVTKKVTKDISTPGHTGNDSDKMSENDDNAYNDIHSDEDHSKPAQIEKTEPAITLAPDGMPEIGQVINLQNFDSRKKQSRNEQFRGKKQKDFGNRNQRQGQQNFKKQPHKNDNNDINVDFNEIVSVPAPQPTTANIELTEKPVNAKIDEQLPIAQDSLQKTEQISKVEIKSEIETKSEPIEQTKTIENNKQDIVVDKKEETSEELSEAEISRRKKKKRKGIMEVEPGETPQLRGLTVLGKISVEKDDSKILKPKKKLKPTDIDPEKDDDVTIVKAKFKKRKRKDSPEEHEAPKPKVFTNPPAASAASKLKEDKRKKKRKKTIREQISQEDVEKAIKETLSGMDSNATGVSRQKIKQKRKLEREEKELRHQEEVYRESMQLQLTEFVTTSDLANLMNISANEIILKCMELGLMVTINQRLDKDTLILIADDYGFEVQFVDETQVNLIEDEDDAQEDLKPRPPIVTIMGHVDHGKTSLLDFIRKANVVSGEAGGITQHIGAYRVSMPDNKSITFLDTPGHEAFTAMRARGAQVTDIVVLVVAADDSVMPQTIEAISHANAANVPIVVAINKIDKPDANPDRIKQQLADHGILVEDWGGKYQSVEISAKKGINVDVLLDKILLEAEMLDLKANPDRKARGIVVESNMTKGLGSTATIIVQKGTLKVGDPFVSGVYSGKVRAMMDEKGNKVEFAAPADPVMVIGFEGLPEAGDNFVIANSDSEAKIIATERKQLKREQELRQVRHMTLDQISAQIQIGGVKELYLVIKADVAGSAEALSDSLLKLSTEEVKVNILHKGVGAITETDVMLAAASQAVIIGFNTSPSGQARKLAEKEFVDIRKYDIIYDCINEVHLALEGLLTPDKKEEITSEVEVRETFKISKVGTIAGCYVTSGKIMRNDKVRLIRDGFKVFEGSIASLKRGKDDAREVNEKFECGIQLDGFNDVKIGDIIEGFKIIEVKRTLS